jgi:hypothetical protein
MLRFPLCAHAQRKRERFARIFKGHLLMNEPTIICANCKSEIKLTESLTAPLVEATRLQFQRKIAQKDAEIAKREAAIHEQTAAIERAREAIDDQVSQKLKAERERIIAEQAKKARLILEADI